MAGYTLAQIEDAIVSRLQAALGGSVKTIESYQGELEEAVLAEGWRLPAILVGLRGSRAWPAAQHSHDVDLVFTLLVLDSNLRGNEANRQASGGVYDLLMGVRQALWDQDLGLEMEPLRLRSERPCLNDRERAVWAAEYGTRVLWET